MLIFFLGGEGETTFSFQPGSKKNFLGAKEENVRCS